MAAEHLAECPLGGMHPAFRPSLAPRPERESYVTAEARYAARQRDDEWFTVLQVRHEDGRWYSRLSTQRPAWNEMDARQDAWLRAATARQTRRRQDGD
jgi:hypothetical protein